MTHFVKIAYRSFLKNKRFGIINLSGLAVGLAACWMILLYVQREHSYDRFLPDADRICAVALSLKMGDQEGRTTNTPPPIGPRLAADFPEVELTARTFSLGSAVVQRKWDGHAPLVFNESTAMAADTSFLEIFGFPMLAGDHKTALDKPGSLVLTEKMAAKYFGNEPAMGQSLLINDRPFKVSGIVKNLPATSTVQFDFLLHMGDFKVIDIFAWSWIWLQMDTWVKLRRQPDAAYLASLESKFPAMVRQYAPAAYERIGQNFEEQLRKGDRYDIELLPLTTLHLGSNGIDSRLTTLGDAEQVQIFAIIGSLILLLACVNFMNLSTARSLKRAREVGVRKALGSQREALVGQFMTEALFFSFSAMVLAAGLAGLAMPLFNQLTGLEFQFADLFTSNTLLWVLLLPLTAGLLGGLYPALFLSKFKPIDIFKTASGGSKSGHAGIRGGLVVFQFAVSIALMVCSLVVYRQLDFARHQSPGLQRDHVLVIPNTRHLNTPTAREAFMDQLRQMPEAIEATHSTFLPSRGSFGDFYEPEQGQQNSAVVQNLPISSFMTDANFVPTLGIEILQGRNFLPHSTDDSASVILNETAVKAIGWENPVGKWMRYPGNENQRFQVVGIMRDFHLSSVKTPIEPTALFHESSHTYQTFANYAAVRLKDGMEKTAVEKAAAIWKTMAPGAPFEHDFLDASYARLYRSEAKMGAVLGVFTGLALFIGCLGLFALAAFTAEQRTKEIGIRKVLGASVSSLAGLLATDFLKLVAISIAIASPVAYYFMQKWLANYAYRIELHWWMFVSAGLAAVGIATLTITYQSLKAALANPVHALRNE